MGKDTLSKGEELCGGSSLESSNGKFKAVYQDDGNFVIYQGSTPVWATNTHGMYCVRVCMQDDCNLVVYSDRGKPRWSSGTDRGGVESCNLKLTDDGHLVITADGEEIWSSASS